MAEIIVTKVGAFIASMWIVYLFVIQNPLNVYTYTHNLKFTWIVFKAQFTMTEFEFAHEIWNHPLAKPYKKEVKNYVN